MEATSHSWTVRVEGGRDPAAKVYSRNHVFTVGQQANFDIRAAHLSAVEYLLGALGADLTAGFQAEASRRRVPIVAVEMRLSGRLNNPLTHLGVIGEAGHPGFESINGTLYVGSDAAPSILEELWRTTLERSPLFNTLKPCVALNVSLETVL